VIGIPDEGTHEVRVSLRAQARHDACLDQGAIAGDVLEEHPADREVPGIHVAGVDLSPRRKPEQAPLGRPIRPERKPGLEPDRSGVLVLGDLTQPEDPGISGLRERW
jgi:hypothetical protein